MAFASPKRKHEDSPTPAPRTTDLAPHLRPSRDPRNGADLSPRTRIAGKLQDMEINGLVAEQPCRESVPVINCPSSASSCQTVQNVPSPSLSNAKRSPPLLDCVTEPDDATKTRPHNVVTVQSSEEPPASKRRAKSPPLRCSNSDQYWHESEITGYSPDDPNDDGYGINGVGFKPSPAIAWSRSQRRKQQLADYRSREAREARQRRSERRRVGIGDSPEESHLAHTPKKSARVHFEDG